jgi:hypothetical protein
MDEITIVKDDGSGYVIYKKNNPAGGETYYMDMGFTMVLWDTAINTVEDLKAVLNDIERSTDDL